MSKRTLSATTSLAAALTIGLLGIPGLANAQDAEEDIVVTGSNIRGTPEDAALPVDVITAQTLEEQGSPTIVQLVRSLSSASGAYGESFRFAGAPPGAATVNLRGLGSHRSLVLLNSRRIASTVPIANAAGNAVDLNLMPSAAIGRVEVLRDGAAAVYGSDAIGGVLNFITRRDLEGFEVDSEYSAIEGSDGDYRAALSWGWRGDSANILISAGYRHRSELGVLDRDYAHPAFFAPSTSGFVSSGSPGGYNILTQAPVRDPTTGAFTNTPTSTGVLIDPGCTTAGNVFFAGACQFRLIDFENLTNPEDAYQVYGEVNYELAPDLDFHAELAWFRRTSEQRIAPMSQTAQFPTPIANGGVSPFPAAAGQQYSRYYIPTSNPGLRALYTACAPGTGLTAQNCTDALNNGVLTGTATWRALGPGGSFLYADGSDRQFEEVDGFRASVGLRGRTFWDIGWDAAVTYTNADRFQEQHDPSINRLQLALRGLGGPNCDPRPVSQGGDYNPATDAPTPASIASGRCMFLNPFSNSIQASTGVLPVPQSTGTQAVPGLGNLPLANNPEMVRWLFATQTAQTNFQNLTGDLIFDGSLPLELWGGPIQWAVGFQYRYDRTNFEPDRIFDIDVTGCPDSPPFGDGTPVCSPAAGSTIFYVGLRGYDIDRITNAAYGELRLPVTDDLEISAALRHETFGDLSTTDPRVSVRWQAVPWLALRASAGSTFRAPGQQFLLNEPTRGLINFSAIGVYRPSDLWGNPNLQPETANTMSAGFVVDAGNFRASVDYFEYEFQDEITTESASSMFNAFYAAAGFDPDGAGPGAAIPQASFCETTNATIVALRNSFNFASGSCKDGSDVGFGTRGMSDFNGVREYRYINGPGVNSRGIDFSASYDFDDVYGGALTLGVDGTRNLEWVRGALRSPRFEGLTLAASQDRLGFADSLQFFYAIPEWKANAFANYSHGPANIRWTTHYTSSLLEIGGNILAAAYPQAANIQLDAQITHDLTMQYQFGDRMQVTFNVQNLTDEDPPVDPIGFYGYLPLASDVAGRVFEIGLKARF